MKFGDVCWGVWGPGAPHLTVVKGRLNLRSGGMSRLSRARGGKLLVASSQVFRTRLEAVRAFNDQMGEHLSRTS
jgi:hypothetical protein